MNFTSWTPKFVRVWFVSVHTDFISRKYMNTHDRDGRFQGVLTVAPEQQPCGVQVVEGVGLVARNPMLKSGQGFLDAGHQLLELLRVLGSVLAEEGGGFSNF